jgi:SET domain-containing protein
MPSRKTKPSPSRTKSKAKATTRGGSKRGTPRRPVKRTGGRYASPRHFELRTSPIQGTGAFATTDIKKGTRLIEYVGEKISHEEADRRYDDEKMKRHHTFLFTLDDNWIIDAAVGGNEAMYINHSCDPNCEAVIVGGKRIYIEAKKNIPEGTELVYDYQYERRDDHTAEDEKFYACRCGSPKCRGSILTPKKPKRSSAGAKKSRA